MWFSRPYERASYIGCFWAALMIASCTQPQTDLWSDEGASETADTVSAVLDLDERTFQRWWNYILPSKSELAFEKVAWLPSFWEGLVAADDQRKPLLLWVMNGHPLGCT